MNIRLEGKVAIVTGSVQGIGRASAEFLAKGGASVVINNNTNEEELEKTAKEIASGNGNVKAVLADVTIKEDGRKLIDAALELGGSIDILVNNAGGLVKRVPVAEFDEAHFNTVININLKTAFLMSHLVMPYMKEKKSGKIINLSSQAAHDGGGDGSAPYSASKGGIWTLTKSLAKELGAFGITVNCVAPGFIANTVFHNTFTAHERGEKIIQSTPLKRAGCAEDVAKVVLFLASELSDFMTGQTLEVNGGLYMH